LKYKGYIGSAQYAAEDRVFYGKVEGINELISFEGSTVDELEDGFQYMVDKHLEDCKKKNIPPEKSYKADQFINSFYLSIKYTVFRCILR